MSALLLWLTVAATAPASVRPASAERLATESWASMDGRARAALLLRHAHAPLTERVLQSSARFLGTPYVHSPLGEGEGWDPDPLIRFDAVDCLTFVEESLALAGSRGSEERLATELAALRYGLSARYPDRNHLMEAQWLPHNLARGFLRDVTDRYGKQDAVWAKKVITAESWRSTSSAALRLPPERQLVGEFPLRLLPLEKVMARAKDIPSGTVMVIVREDKPSKVTRVTHLGFVVQKGARTYLRHAARNNYLRVIDEDLETFLGRNGRYEKWRVSGVSLYEPRERSFVSGRARDRLLRLKLLFFSGPGGVLRAGGQAGALRTE